MEFLRDQIWQFWGAVIGALALLITVIFFILQRKNKRLTYSILTETPLLSVDDELRGKIKIQYGRKSIQNIYLVLLQIQNQGNVDIASSDYEKPITFSFENSEILSIETVEVSPKSLTPTIISTLSSFTIEPILLNKKDHIVIKLLFSNYGRKVNVETHILGVKDIERFDKNVELISWRKVRFDVAIITVFMVLVLLLTSPSATNDLKQMAVGALTLLFLWISSFRK